MNTTTADYFTFNVDSSLLLVGMTGTGKTELVRRYINKLEKAFTPEQMQYVIYDLKQVEFTKEGEIGNKAEYAYTSLRYGKPEDMDYLEELAKLAEKRAQTDQPEPLLFIYIEECDMAIAYPDRFHAAVMTINKFAKQANMKLIFSTSRPSRDIIPQDFRDSFDLILCGKLASTADEETVGITGATALSQREFLVRDNHHHTRTQVASSHARDSL